MDTEQLPIKKNYFGELKSFGFSNDIVTKASSILFEDKKKDASEAKRLKRWTKALYYAHIELGIVSDPQQIARKIGYKGRLDIPHKKGHIFISTIRAFIDIFLDEPKMAMALKYSHILHELADELDNTSAIPCMPQYTAAALIQYILEREEGTNYKDHIQKILIKTPINVNIAYNYIKAYFDM